MRYFHGPCWRRNRYVLAPMEPATASPATGGISVARSHADARAVLPVMPHAKALFRRRTVGAKPGSAAPIFPDSTPSPAGPGQHYLWLAIGTANGLRCARDRPVSPRDDGRAAIC